MADNRIVFEGLEDLKAALRTMPTDLAGEAASDVEGAANYAAVAVRSLYGQHRVTGHLQEGVEVSHTRTQFGAKSVVVSKAPHAWLFENGSQARHYTTKTGKMHTTGAMPPFHIFIPTVIRERRRMYEQLKAMLVRHGFIVAGDA